MTLQAHVAEAFAECNETRHLLIEWRDAREAFLTAEQASPKDFDALEPLLNRVISSTDALMTYARQYGPRR